MEFGLQWVMLLAPLPVAIVFIRHLALSQKMMMPAIGFGCVAAASLLVLGSMIAFRMFFSDVGWIYALVAGYHLLTIGGWILAAVGLARLFADMRQRFAPSAFPVGSAAAAGPANPLHDKTL